MEYPRVSCYDENGVAEIIIKHREKPAKIAGYEAMLKRLPGQHPKRSFIQEALNACNAGFGGEKRLDHLLKHFDPPYPYLLIQDLSLSESEECQVDTVLITQSFMMLLEVKNLSGLLRFSENPSALHQHKQGERNRTYKSPVVQAETAKLKIEKVLKRMQVQLPVRFAIVIAYPNQVVEDVPQGAVVWSASEVMIRLHQMEMAHEYISMEEMKDLGNQLLAAEEEFQAFPLAPKFGIPLTEIERGVFCPKCILNKMERRSRSWECASCRLISTDIHLQALDDWFMLCSSTINTKECKDFLGLKDLDAAKRVLKRKGLEEIGGRRHRIYVEKKKEKP